MVVSVPNETGLVGLLKLGARRLIRPSTDADALGEGSIGRYLRALIMNRRIDGYRPQQTGYGSHLGFDYRALIDYIDEAYVACDELVQLEVCNTSSRTGVVLVWRKGAEMATEKVALRSVLEG